MQQHPTSTPAQPPPPLLAGRYELQGVLGYGGMAQVFEARQRPFDRKVAIKFMRPEHLTDARLSERFAQEAQTISRLSHPNTVRVYDFGQTRDGVPYMVMEHVEGVTLAQSIQSDGPLAFDQAISYAIQIAQSLGEAHHKGIVHRDLKPDNIMVVRPLGTEPFVKVLDFGIAKLLEPRSSWTEVGNILGTPYYMAPEQALQRPIDGRTDLYSLGCCLYEFLIGRPPFSGSTIVEVLMAHQHHEPPQLPERFPTKLNELLQSMMNKDPESRPPDTSTFIARLMMSVLHAPQRPASTFTPTPSIREARPSPRLSSTLPMSSIGQLLRQEEPSAAEDQALYFTTPMPASSPLKQFAALSQTRSAPEPEFETLQDEPSLSAATPASQGLSAPAPPPLPSRPPDASLSPSSALNSTRSMPPRRAELEPELKELATVEKPDALDEAPPGAASPPEGGRRGRRRWASALFGVSVLGAVCVAVWVGWAASKLGQRQVEVRSEPEGALVELDGVPVGRTPMTLELSDEDSTALRILKRGFVPFETNETRSTQGSLFAQLERRTVDLTVSSHVAGAALSVNGQEMGALGGAPRIFSIAWPEDELMLTLRHPEYADFIYRIPAERVEEELDLTVSPQMWPPK